jgi:hypothetical protein
MRLQRLRLPLCRRDVLISGPSTGVILCRLSLDLRVSRPNVSVKWVLSNRQENSMTRSSRQTRPDAGWTFDNSYARLPEAFYVRLNPSTGARAETRGFQRSAGAVFGAEPRCPEGRRGRRRFLGQQDPRRGRASCPGLCGASIRFFHHAGRWAGNRAGRARHPKGERFDIQYKGSGKTPFSRQGDGRAALGPMLREYIISEALHALGIPTTRSLAVVTTGEPVFRETVPAGGDSHPHGGQPHPRGHVRVCGGEGQTRRGPDAGRLHHPPPLS